MTSLPLNYRHNLLLQPTVQPAMINYEDLLCIFRQPVYKGHHTLKVPMAIIVEALLDKTISELEDIATLHIAALHVFPGLISLHINKRKGKATTFSLVDVSAAICRVAISSSSEMVLSRSASTIMAMGTFNV